MFEGFDFLGPDLPPEAEMAMVLDILSNDDGQLICPRCRSSNLVRLETDRLFCRECRVHLKEA